MDTFDNTHLWHPYTSLKTPLPTHKVKSAKGVYLELENGQRLIDGMSSWWCVIHGYNHPELNQAAKAQIDRVSHVMFGGLTHQPAIDLGKTLLGMVPADFQHIFYSDSGSVAVEVAMKMAVQYWRAQGQARTRFLSFRKGYHGDTLSAMSVSDPDTGMHQEFSGYISENVFAAAPPLGFTREPEAEELAAIEKLMQSHRGSIAAMILEPIVQGAGGMRIYSPAFLDNVVALARANDMLVIFDEIATGFGRTGALFASNHVKNQADILCLGKALTGGYLSLAATLCNQKVVAGINQHGDGTFMHGPTFMANPLACAIAQRSLELLTSQDWQARVAGIEAILRRNLFKLAEHPKVNDVRVLGAIGVVELKQAVNMTQCQQFFVERGLWIRPFGRLMYLMPPYVIGEEELEKLCLGIQDYLEEHNPH